MPGVRLAGICIALLASTLAYSPRVEARTEQALRACMARNLPQTSFRQDLRLDVRGRDGTRRQMTGTFFWQKAPGGQNGMLRLSLPKDLAGYAYLFREKKGEHEFHVYMPALKKVRELDGASAEQALFDSGLSAFDLALLLRGLSGGGWKYLSSDSSSGRAAESWRFTPPNDPNILYDRIDFLIDTVWCLPLEAKLFGGVPWKTLSLDRKAVIQRDGRWLARRVHVKDLREGTQTTLELFNEQFDPQLSPKLFAVKSFYKTP